MEILSVSDDITIETNPTMSDSYSIVPLDLAKTESGLRRSNPLIRMPSFIHPLNHSEKKRTCTDTIDKFISTLFENPDGRVTNFQRAFIVLYSLFEAYRTVISSYLIVFVPQKCGAYSCTITQNITPIDNLETAAISINTIMAAYFCGLFFLEKRREKTVKQYLVADKSSPTDKEYLIAMLQTMDPKSREDVLKINMLYRIYTQVLLVLFFVNIGTSAVVVNNNYLNNTTATVFITNALFMINRIYKAMRITSSGEYNIYSAYRSDGLLYNRDRTTWLTRKSEESFVV